MHKNTARLRAIMSEHGLTPKEVGDLTGRSYQTVLVWRSVNDQNIPDTLLELLEYKIKDRIAGGESADERTH